MSTGDKQLATRPRGESNERFDLVEFTALAIAAQTAMEAAVRALLSSPKATAGSPTGERWTGSLTANPTSGSDGLLRMDSPVFVGLDANGGLVLKPNGTALSVAIPAGGSNQQVYAYMTDAAENTQVRRFIPATSPFNEFPQSINVALRQTCSLFVRAGSAGSVVAEDVVAGATRPLLFLGIATNTGGAVTFTPGANTLETVTQPASMPTTQTGITAGGTTTTGSQSTLRELVNAALYQIGQLWWAGSGSPPNAGNNFQAFTSIPKGVLATLASLFDATAEGTVTPITVWRDYQLNRRALIDHNGYRMGQVSEVDEHWRRAGTQSIFVSAASANGTPANATPVPVAPGVQFDNGAGGGIGSVYWSALSIKSGMTITAAVLLLGHFTGAGGSTVQGDLFDVSSAVDIDDNAVTVATATSALDTPLSLTGTNYPWTVLSGHTINCAYGVTVFVGNSFAVGTVLTCIVDPEGWTWTPTNNGPSGCQRSYVDPDANINQRSLKLAGQGTGAQSGVFTAEAYEVFMNADVAYAQEWILRTGTISDANNTRLFAIGIQNNNGGAGNRFIYFYNQNTTANWQLRVVGSSTADNDTGVAIAANTTYRMRIEILGANVSTAGGGNFRVRGYINGAKVVDVVSTTLPAADMIRPYFVAGVTGTSVGAYDYRIGRVRRAWNHLLNGDNL